MPDAVTPPDAPPPGDPLADAAAGLARRAGQVEATLDAAASAYLATVRDAAGALARHDPDPGDVRAALAEVAARSAIDVDVPVGSRRPALRYVKGGVKAAGGWYLRYVAQQVTALGHSVSALGEVLSARLDAADASTAALAARVTAVEGRLARLEARADEAGER